MIRRASISALAFLVSGLLAGCSGDEPCSDPGAHPPDDGNTGGICRDGSHPAAPNVLDNPGFECGLDGWDVNPVRRGELTQETTVVRSGKGAARLTVTNARAELMSLATVQNPPPGSTWCAWAWMKGTTPVGKLDLTRAGSNVAESFFTPVEMAEWSRAPYSYALKVTTAPEDTAIYFSVEITEPAVGDYLIVDDLELWQSPDGSCSER